MNPGFFVYTAVMPARILSGNEAASSVLEALKPRVKLLNPRLVVVQVGEHPASESYIRKKLQSAAAIGMRAEVMKLADDVTLESLLTTVEKLNADADVTAFLVQLPLPGTLSVAEPLVMRAIDPRKDADGFTAYNLGKMFLSPEFEHLPPATPTGIVLLLEHYGIAVEGKHVVIVGRSNIVGKPLAVMLINRGATVTVCNSKTTDLGAITRQADILVSAAGKVRLIRSHMIKPGAVVIDVGMNRDEERLTGDVDFEEASDVASAITPVPGGVGPMTVASLLRNCVRAKERQMESKSGS